MRGDPLDRLTRASPGVRTSDRLWACGVALAVGVLHGVVLGGPTTLLNTLALVVLGWMIGYLVPHYRMRRRWRRGQG